MAEAEVNVISHLLDVEHSASGLVTDAQVEADKRIAAARSKADALYKEQYEKIIQETENKYKTKTEQIDAAHEKSIADYKKALQETQEDLSSFNAYLDTLLFNA